MAAASNKGQICASSALVDGGPGVRFVVASNGRNLPAFAVRFRGTVYAYINQCAHQSLELDWKQGNFFDMTGDFLMCATHGARYLPDTGACAGGRCDGQALNCLDVLEGDNLVYLADAETHLVKGLIKIAKQGRAHDRYE